MDSKVSYVSEGDLKVIQDRQQDSIVVLDKAQNLEIVNENGYGIAIELLKVVKAKIKALDEARRIITKPMDQAKKAVMDLFRTPQDNFRKAENKLKQASIEYTNKIEQEKREAEKETGVVLPPEEKTEGAHYREVWDFSVIDKEKVPKKFMVVNEQMLREFAKATKGSIKVAGVKFFSRKQMVVKSG